MNILKLLTPEQKIMFFVSLIMYFGGLGLLIFVDWKIAIAVFIMQWGENIAGQITKF